MTPYEQAAAWARRQMRDGGVRRVWCDVNLWVAIMHGAWADEYAPNSAFAPRALWIYNTLFQPRFARDAR